MAENGHELKTSLVLVDGHNLLWRAAFGFPARIRSRSGIDRTATFGFFALLRVAAKEIDGPCEWVVCFDGENGAARRRHTESAYKQNRASIDLAPLQALPDVKAGLEHIGIPWIEERENEADDLIATLIAAQAGGRVFVFSTDRDFYQLLSNLVYVLNTAMKAGSRVVGPSHVMQRFGVSPIQWCDFRALTGDPADNIAGVRGVGPRIAARLLSGGAKLEELDVLGRLTGRLGPLIQSSLPQLLNTREILRLRTDAPVLCPVQGGAFVNPPRPADVLQALGLWS